MQIKVVYDCENARAVAEQYCTAFGFDSPLKSSEHHVPDAYWLHFSKSGVYLTWQEDKKKPIELRVDFSTGANAHRRHFGGGKGQAIAKAVGVQSKFKPTILDCTAGQGGDAFVLASLGCRVTMLERSPVAYALLNSGLDAIKNTTEIDVELDLIAERLSLLFTDALKYLAVCDTKFDVVYLDPMFPERKKSAAVKKDMRVFHELIGADEDAHSLLTLAKATARYRTVVKRSKLAPFLAEEVPTYSLRGKSTRFDIYVNKALPSMT